MNARPGLGTTPYSWILSVLLIALPFGAWRTPVVGVPLNYLLTASIAVLTIPFLFREVRIQGSQALLIGFQLLLIIWMGVATLANPGSGGELLVANFGYLIWTVGIILIVQNKQDWYRVISGLCIGGIIAGILTMLAAGFLIPIGSPVSPNRSIGAVTIPFVRVIGAPLSYGSFGMLIIGTFAYSMARWRIDASTIYVIGAVSAATAIVVSQARSTWLATVAAAGVALFAWTTTRYSDVPARLRLGLKTALAGGVVAGIMLAIPVSEAVLAMSQASTATRIEQYIAAIHAIESNPVFGVGPANTFEVYAQHEIHNAHLKLGVEAGIPALLLALLATGLALLKSWHTVLAAEMADHLVALAVMGAVVAVVIESQFVAGFSRYGWIWFATAISAPLHSPTAEPADQRLD